MSKKRMLTQEVNKRHSESLIRVGDDQVTFII